MNSTVSELGQTLGQTQALLIFYGKAGVYLKALSKTQPEQWQSWIA